MKEPQPFSQFEAPGRRLWLRTDLAEEPGPWLADGVAHLAACASDETVGHGRGAARRISIGDREGVWRQNRHGGLLGPCLGDRYLGADRLAAEVSLSEQLRAAEIPTPAILVGLAERRGGFWRQHLVTELVPDAQTVFAARADERALQAAADLLTAIFDAGAWLPDLHPGNLLWQASLGRCWLIDLAGGSMRGRALDESERRQRRARFARYFRKHSGSVPAAFSDWLAG